jgi:hypothetical protein
VRLNALCFYCSVCAWEGTGRAELMPRRTRMGISWCLPARYWGRMLRRKDYAPRPAVEKRAIIVKWETGRVKSPTSG